MLAIEHPTRQPLPASVTPMLVAVRPNTPSDPTIEPVKESSNVGTLVILAPTPQKRVEFRNQLFGFQRNPPLGALPYLVHDTTDGLRLGVCIECTLSGLATNLALGQIKLPLPALDYIAEELKAIPDMDDPRFLRM